MDGLRRLRFCKSMAPFLFLLLLVVSGTIADEGELFSSYTCCNLLCFCASLCGYFICLQLSCFFGIILFTLSRFLCYEMIWNGVFFIFLFLFSHFTNPFSSKTPLFLLCIGVSLYGVFSYLVEIKLFFLFNL